MTIQAFIGFLMIEYALHKLRRFRDGNEERDSKFPGIRRLDVDKWSRWRLYPGALLTMPTRAFMFPIAIILKVFLGTIVCIGHDFSKGPLQPGCRLFIIKVICSFFTWFYCVLAGVWTTTEEVDFDYTEYLGPNYKTL